MHNIDVNDLIYERDLVETDIWRVTINDSSGESLVSAPAVLNVDGTINYVESYNVVNNVIKDIEFDNYKSLCPAQHNGAADVYVGGEIKRIDYLISETEGQALLDILEERFPAYDLSCCPINFIGSYGAYRPPYTATSSISVYDFDGYGSGNSGGDPACDFADYLHRRPPLAKYNVDTINVYTLAMMWFGYKFNLDTGTVSMKIVHRNRIPTVTYPPAVTDMRSTYFARIHNEDGTIDNMNDMYFDAHWEDVQEYCTEHNITYPIPDEGVDQTHVMVWGVVFNGTTGVPTMMKGYVSRDVENPIGYR